MRIISGTSPGIYKSGKSTRMPLNSFKQAKLQLTSRRRLNSGSICSLNLVRRSLVSWRGIPDMSSCTSCLHIIQRSCPVTMSSSWSAYGVSISNLSRVWWAMKCYSGYVLMAAWVVCIFIYCCDYLKKDFILINYNFLKNCNWFQ